MDSFEETNRFGYNPNEHNIDGELDFSGILEIYVHHARNIHNICIYDNQDVYAKFSLTYNPDETILTRIINGGGKNPDFNQNLLMKITQLDAVLKCEIWMLSRARNLMEDQLLGFALVPISSVVGKGKVTQDFSLSSTDLFHSPAGTVQLTLSLNSSVNSFSEIVPSSSISSEVVLLDRKVMQEAGFDPVEYSRIEFPDISVVHENQKMVSEYFNYRPGVLVPASFLHLGAAHQHVDDYEMAVNSSEETPGESVSSPNGSIHNSGFMSSTTTSLSDDEKRSRLVVEISNSPGTPTSKKGIDVKDEKESNFSIKEDEPIKEGETSCVKFGKVSSRPIANMSIEAEQSVMQKQIVDMYMRSMQQFTESLAKMKLPMDLDHSPEMDSEKGEKEAEKIKKDGSKVFYGSRAFF